MIAQPHEDWFEVTPTGLKITGEISEERWRELGGQLATNYRSLMWLIGDWINAGEKNGYLPHGKLHAACEVFGISYDVARDASYVCAKIKCAGRTAHLSFTHHKTVASRDDAKSLLDWAVSEKATVNELRMELKRRDALAIPHSPEPKPTAKRISQPEPKAITDARPAQQATTLTIARQASVVVNESPALPAPTPRQASVTDHLSTLSVVDQMRSIVKAANGMPLDNLAALCQTLNSVLANRQKAEGNQVVSDAAGSRGELSLSFDALDLKIPEKLDTPAFREAWTDWVSYNAEEGHPLRERSATKQIKELESYGVRAAINAINTAIANRAKSFPAKRESKAAAFIPPTVEEVRQYISENNIEGVNPDGFHSFYTGKGWKIGTSKMADWKAAVRTWKTNGYGSGKQTAQPQTNLTIPSSFKAINIPAKLETPAFYNSLCAWGEAMQANGKPPAIPSMQTIVDKLSEYSERRAIGYLKAWTASGRFTPVYDDCYEAYQPPETKTNAPVRQYEPLPPIGGGKTVKT